MTQSLAMTVQKLEQRAATFRTLVDDETHPRLVASLQRPYAVLLGAAELAAALEPAAAAFVDRKVVGAKQRPGVAATADAVIALSATVSAFGVLVRSGAALSRGRDAETVKQLGAHLLNVTLKAGARLSGIGYIQDAADLIVALEDGAKIGQQIRLRREQISVASAILRWTDGVTLASLAWCHGAERFLLATQSRGGLGDDAVWDLVLERLTRVSRRWYESEP